MKNITVIKISTKQYKKYPYMFSLNLFFIFQPTDRIKIDDDIDEFFCLGILCLSLLKNWINQNF